MDGGGGLTVEYDFPNLCTPSKHLWPDESVLHTAVILPEVSTEEAWRLG